MKLKKLKEIKKELYEGILGGDSHRYDKQAMCESSFDFFAHHLRFEAIRRVKDCEESTESTKGTLVYCGEMGYCPACKRDIWFNDLTRGELK